jgi:dipeptide/tripeptide permease
VFGGAWAPVVIGIISDLLGGGGMGLAIALAFASVGAILAAVCFWMGSKHYASDMDKVKDFVLEVER